MEALEDQTSSLVARVRRAFRRRWVRIPTMFITGAVITAGIAAWIHPRWLELCEAAKPGGECQPITYQLLTGYLVVLLGVVMLIAGPIVNSLYRVMRYGQPWETSRVETAVSNLPILVGFLYLAMGLVLVTTA